LPPDGLARLALAQRYGKVSLAIRLPSDSSTMKPVSAVLADLVPYAQPKSSSSIHKHRTPSGITFYSGIRTTALSRGGS
jgi:Flp pilus assembly protein CpaB